MSHVHLSDITFRRNDLPGVLQLRLAGAIERRPGVSPGVVRAFAPARQMDAFASDLSADGRIVLYDGNPGERKVVLDGYRIVDAYPAADVDGEGRPVEWEVFLADSRRQFVKPLGGELVVGEINRAPVNRATQRDAQGRDLVQGEDLVALCMAAMGVVPAGGVPAIPAERRAFVPTDLKWSGAWAPGELEELCKAFGLLFCPLSSGGFAVGVLGVDEPPQMPTPGVVTPLPATGRPTDVVVFRSTPTPKLLTLSMRGPSPIGGITDGFEWVLPDEDDQGRLVYVNATEASWLSGANLPGDLNGPLFAARYPLTLEPKWRGVIRRDLFRLIRVPTSVWGRVPKPLNELYEAEAGPVGEPMLVGSIAELDPSTAKWVQSDDARVRVIAIYDGGPAGPVLALERSVFRLKAGLESADDVTIWFDADPLGPDDAVLASTFEELDEDGRPVPFVAGFRRTPSGGVEQLAAAELATVSPAAAVSEASLVLITERGLDGNEVDNREEVTARARSLAESVLGVRGRTTEVVLPGYWTIELSGAVSAVSYSQTPPETRYTIGGHFRPAAAKAGVGGAAAVGHTPSRSTEAARAAAGASDTSPTRRVLVDTPAPPAIAAEPVNFVHVDAREQGAGKYRARMVTIPTTESPTTAAALPALGEAVLLVNLGEVGGGGDPTHVLGLETVVGPVRFGGQLDLPPPEGSPEGTPRDRRRVAYVALGRQVFRSFRTREGEGFYLLEGSYAAQPTADEDWIEILLFGECPPPGGA